MSIYDETDEQNQSPSCCWLEENPPPRPPPTTEERVYTPVKLPDDNVTRIPCHSVKTGLNQAFPYQPHTFVSNV